MPTFYIDENGFLVILPDGSVGGEGEEETGGDYTAEEFFTFDIQTQ